VAATVAMSHSRNGRQLRGGGVERCGYSAAVKNSQVGDGPIGMVLADDGYAIAKSDLFLTESIGDAANLREHRAKGDGLRSFRLNQQHGHVVRPNAGCFDNSLTEGLPCAMIRQAIYSLFQVTPSSRLSAARPSWIPT
jgi:hypothetical protein